MTAAIRVGGRRWNLRIDNGIDVKLPRRPRRRPGPSSARLERDYGILERDLTVIDLRLPDQLLVRLAPTARHARQRRQRHVSDDSDENGTSNEAGGVQVVNGWSRMRKARHVPARRPDRRARRRHHQDRAASSPASATSGQPQVIGIGHQISHGVRGGAIVDMEAAERAILTTVHAAEQMAGETIRDVVVNVSGGYPASQTIGVEVDDRRPRGQRRRPAAACSTTATMRNGADDRRLIHSIPVGYSIDGSRGIRDPRGMFGERLGVDMHLVTAAAGPLRNLQTCVERCHLDIEALVVAPYAAGLADPGRGRDAISASPSSTWAAARRRSPSSSTATLIFTDAIPIGGGHVTNDIARGLSTPLAHAERMKTLYGSCIPSPADEREMITRAAGRRRGSRQRQPRCRNRSWSASSSRASRRPSSWCAPASSTAASTRSPAAASC